MLKNLIKLLFILLPAIVFGQSPGGVSAPDLWIKSDDAGNIATAWKDHSANADNIPAVGTWSLSPADRAHNFHPYTTGYTASKLFYNPSSLLNGAGSSGPLSHSIISAVRTLSGGTGRITGIDDDVSFASEPAVSINDGNPSYYKYSGGTITNNFSAVFPNASNIFSTVSDNGTAVGGGSSNAGGEQRLGLNGAYELKNDFGSGNRFQLFDRRLRVGHGGWTAAGPFPGDIMEVIWYKRALTTNEQSRVNTYLALKNGVTLAEDYLTSSNDVIWNRTANTGYNSNVFGLARDNTSGLHQKQAASTESSQKLVIGHGANLFESNEANTNSLTEGQFLMAGDNGLSQSLSVALSYPTAPGGKINNRFASIWKVQNTNTVGQVIVAWPKGISNLHLIKSSGDATFDTSDTFIPMSSEVTINGVVYNTATVTFNNGDYFTFAGYAHAPGGVFNALSYWYRADKNAANTGAGTDVTSWTDFSSGTVVAQMGTNALPKYAAGATDYFNFNPGVNFTAQTQTLGNIGVRTVSQLGFDIFTFTKEVTENGGNPRIFSSLVDNALPTGSTARWDGIGILADGRLERVNNGFADRYLGNPGGTLSETIPSIMYHKFTDLNLSKSLNGAVEGPLGTHAARGLMNGGHAFGSTKFASNNSDNEGFIGHLGETIIYGSGNLTAQERRRVDSYLAIKYGITLGRVATDHYLGSTASIVWNGASNTGYNTNIFGIARDDASALYQKQSKSVNASQKLIIGAGSSLADTNAANTNNLGEGQFLIVGDNDLKQSLAVALSYPAAPGGEINNRFASIWKLQNTNTVGQVIVAWPKGISNLHLIKSSGDATFDTSDAFIPMSSEVTINGVVYNTATVTFNNGDYFTFGGYAHAPGGVINALSYWYRADKNAANTGVGTDITSWTDYFSGTISSQISTAPLPKYVEGVVNYFNYNPGLNFTDGTQKIGNIAVQTFSTLNYDIFTFTKEGMASGGTRSRFFNVGRNNTTLGSDNWDSPGFLINGNIVRRTNTGADLTEYNVTPKFSTTIPSISYHTFTDLNFSRGLNGVENGGNLTHTSRGLMTGGHIFGDNRNPGTGGDDAGFIGHLGETIIYGSGNLTAQERRRVDSYLAIKYGITLGRVATDHYLGSTASANSIVWNGASNTAYNTNIFGIARADIGGFEQKVSKSVNSGTILTVAKNNDFIASNLATSRTGLPNNESYLLFGDNNNTTTVPYTPTEIGDCGEILGSETNIKLIPRKWLVQRTNMVGTTYLQVNLAAYGSALNSDVQMFVADDANFTQNVVMVPGIKDGNNWTFAHNFDSEAVARYITFGGTFVAAPCEQCKGGTYNLRTGYQWNQGLWANQTANAKENILLGNDAGGTPLYASMYADYTANPSIEYSPSRYPQQYGGRWAMSRRYDNTNAKAYHRIQLTQAMKASFQISNINTFQNNKNNFEVIGYCNGVAVLPKITYAYNTSYHTFDIEANKTIGTMSWRGFVPNVSTANVRFDRPVDKIEIICSVDRVNTSNTLRTILYSDITLECAEIVEPTPDNVYVSHNFTQETLATCGGETTMRIKVTNNNLCEDKTIDLHQLLPAGLTYVSGSFNANDLPAGAMSGATLNYSGSSLELSGLTLPRGEHWMYVDVANPGTVGTYPTQFTFEVTDGVDPNHVYSSSIANLTYYQSLDLTPAAPALTLSIKNNVLCGENGMQITYRMKVNNPNATSITGAEVMHMFDYAQVIQSVVFVTGEDENGLISGNYPLDGSGNPIMPVGNNIFNLVDATIPVGVSYIDITVNVGNSYDIPEVQALGISSGFLVGFGSGECAESAESVSNEVVLRMCSPCTKSGATGTALGSTVGIITKPNRSVTNWPESVPNGYLVLDGAFKGMVITHMTTAQIAALVPVKGMLVYDTDANCVKLYRGAGANAPTVHPSRQGWVCIERVCID